MKKPYWLKKSFLKYSINNMLFSIFSVFISKNRSKNKILVTELDGIGDTIVRQRVLEIIAKKYGKENVVVLVTFTKEIMEFEGYQYEIFEKNSHYNFVKLLKLYKKLASYGFYKLYSLEFRSEEKMNFLKKLKFEDIYGFSDGIFENWKDISNKKLTHSKGEKVLDILYNYTYELIDKTIKKEDLIPKLEISTSEGEYISVGVGSSDKNKISSPKKLAEFLKAIIVKKSEIKFHILGNGKDDENYFEELQKEISGDNLINLIGKINIVESTKDIANSKLFIGFDSGLYNIAYALEKKSIIIVSMNRRQHFFHKSNNLKFIHNELNEKKVEVIEDKKYINEDLNSISLGVFEKAFDNLLKDRS